MKEGVNAKEINKEQSLFIPGPQGKLEAYAQGLLVNNPDSLTSDRIPLIGIICHPHPLYQGNMHNKVVTTLTRAWQEMGLSCVRFNFRGVGASTGEYANGEGEQEDLQAIIQWVLEKQPTAKIWLGGFSFGAFISMKVASRNQYPVQALLSVALPLRLFSFSPDTLPEAPWIIIQGDQDELVAYQDVLAWYNEIKKSKSNIQLIAFEEASHFFHGRLIELKTKIMTVMAPYL